MLKLAAATHGLTPDETLLAAICSADATLQIEIDHIAAMCRQARVTQEQVQLHGRQIGADIDLRQAMLDSTRRFVQFFLTLEKLKIVELDGVIQGRVLMGYRGIKILQTHKWISIIHCACDVLHYFGRRCSMVTVYEKLLDFGYGPVKYAAYTKRKDYTAPRQTEEEKKRKSTQKKRSLLLHTPSWMFYQERLDRNAKRYTNGHIKEMQPLEMQPLHPFELLLHAAAKAGDA
jgi:hypothetical protein